MLPTEAWKPTLLPPERPYTNTWIYNLSSDPHSTRFLEVLAMKRKNFE